MAMSRARSAGVLGHTHLRTVAMDRPATPPPAPAASSGAASTKPPAPPPSNPPACHRLVLRAAGFFNVDCEVLRDGAPLTRTSTLYSPVTTGFAIDGRQWTTGIHVPGGRRRDFLRELAVGAFGRACLALFDAGGQPVATAREGGVWKGGYELSLAGGDGQLRWDSQFARLDYAGPGGSGHCERGSERRGMVATLPAVIPAQEQVFIALLALRRWVSFTSSS